MIRHIVVFNVKNTVSPAKIDDAFHAIAKLKTVLPGIKSIQCGVCNYLEEANPKQRFTHGFSIDFDDENSRDNFLQNALAYLAKEKILAIAEGGYAGLDGFEIVN